VPARVYSLGCAVPQRRKPVTRIVRDRAPKHRLMHRPHPWCCTFRMKHGRSRQRPCVPSAALHSGSLP